MNPFYLLAVRGYAFLIRIASIWNLKAKKWMDGRRVVWDELAAWKPNPEKPTYWFHCASLGEFEQGRPLMEALKKNQNGQILITFFSPSGYEIRKNYAGADLVIYLPKETNSNVNRFLKTVQPTAAFFIKYEFWAAYIFKAKSMGIRVYSVSAVFRENQLFFKWYGGYMRNVLRAFDHVFVQDQKSANLLAQIGIKNTLAGDTRYDRVMENAKNVQSFPEIETFVGEHKVLVIGSSWDPDEKIVENLVNGADFGWKVIIAPHELTEGHLKSIETRFRLASVRYSRLNTANNQVFDLLIIDNIGMLMHLYQYATIAYVGGAFGKGLHNILEPASFGVPVIFGHNYKKFTEAFDFIEHKIGFSVANSVELEKTFNELKMLNKQEEVLKYMNERVGATDKILSLI